MDFYLMRKGYFGFVTLRGIGTAECITFSCRRQISHVIVEGNMMSLRLSDLGAWKYLMDDHHTFGGNRYSIH